MTDPAMCTNCRHFGKDIHPDDVDGALHIGRRRRCHRPRMVKETIEWRRPTDWCRAHDRVSTGVWDDNPNYQEDV